jgi:hypothetical protein
MPVIKGPIQAEGALVDVELGWSASRVRQLRAALRPVPSPVRAKALLDTGAEMTCVDSPLIQMLGLPFGGTVTANVPAHGGVQFLAIHDASLIIFHPSGNPPDNLLVRDLSVLDLSLAALGYQVLIGRDVLAKCRFAYDGPKSRFRLAY